MLKIYLVYKLGDLLREEDVIFEFPMQDVPLTWDPHNKMHSLFLFLNYALKYHLVYVDDWFWTACHKLSSECISILHCNFQRVELAPALCIHLGLAYQRELSLSVADIPKASGNNVNGDLLLEVFGKHRSNFRLINLRVLLVYLDYFWFDHPHLAVLFAADKWGVTFRI